LSLPGGNRPCKVSDPDSVQEILDRSQNSFILVRSEMIDEEIFRIGHVQKRELVLGITQFLQEYISIDDEMKQRAAKLMSYGFHAADAIHIACAEKAQATFITTDKQILQVAERNKHQVQCKVYHPTIWLLENTK
jgi:predicted nucleic acid-binding protein